MLGSLGAPEVIVIALIVVDIVCWVNMGDWLSGSALEKDTKNPVTGDVNTTHTEQKTP